MNIEDYNNCESNRQTLTHVDIAKPCLFMAWCDDERN